MELQNDIMITYRATLNNELIEDKLSEGYSWRDIQKEIEHDGINSPYVYDYQPDNATPIILDMSGAIRVR